MFRGVSRNFEKGWHSMSATMVGRRKTFSVSEGLKRPKYPNYFYRLFQIFSIFRYNESLPMKSYHFFKICKRFDKEREKTLMQQSMRKEKLRKVVCFIKSFNMIINHFFCFASSFAAQFLLFDIRMTQEISKGEVGNGK